MIHLATPKKYLALLALLTFLLRLPSLSYTFLDVDESQFAIASHILMDGGQLYTDAVDTKPPFIYLFYQAIFSLFGKYNMTAVHVVSMWIAFCTSLVIFRIGTQIKNQLSGFYAALFFTVFSTCYIPKFIATSITSVMTLPLAASVLAALSGSYFIAGCLTGIAFLFKYQGGIQLPILSAFLIWTYLKRRQEEKNNELLVELTKKFVFLLSGFLLPIFMTGIWIANSGAWNEFVEWSFRGSVRYIQAGGETISFWSNLLLRGGSFVASTLLLWVLTAWTVYKHRTREQATQPLLWFWFLFTLIPVGMGGRFYGHYFIQLLPPLCLLSALFIPSTFSLRQRRLFTFGLMIPAMVFLILRFEYESFDQRFPDDQIFQQKKVGEWIKKNTEENETLFVWGFATAIYFHAERNPVSRFLWTDLLTGKIPGSTLSNQSGFDTSAYSSPLAWKKFWEDMSQNPPDYFVDTSTANIHNYGKYPLSQYKELKNYLDKYYVEWASPQDVVIYKRKSNLENIKE